MILKYDLNIKIIQMSLYLYRKTVVIALLSGFSGKQVFRMHCFFALIP